MPLPTDIDTQYEDDPDNPTVQQHQQHHDALHAQYNDYEGTVPGDFADSVHDHVEADITDLSHYTDTDANAAIDARVDKVFVDALNVDADTLDGVDSTGFSASNHDHAGVYEPSGAVESHRTNDVHTQAQPPQSHGNEAHDEEYATVAQLSGAVPSGIIAMWSGLESEIPTGWNLCDGLNGTPNLTDRFIVGAGTAYTIGDTGGADSVALAEAELPSHSHTSGTLANSTDNHSHGSGNLAAATHSHSDGTLSTPNHTHGSGNLTGGNHGHGSGNLSTGSDGNHTHSTQWLGSGSNVAGGNTFGGGANANTGGGSHNHSISGNVTTSTVNVNGSTDWGGASVVSGDTGDATPAVSGNTTGDNHGHSISGSTGSIGSGSAHENRPSYYALAYIMKA